ncbi:MAG: hypothetical protein ABFS24_16365 [Pseudomonadota bacterium]
MSGRKKPVVLIRSIAGLLGCACCVSLVWSHGVAGGHRDRLEQLIMPDDSYELCLVLAQDQQLRYAFSAPRMLDFNIHYHVGREVFYPVSENQIMDATATFSARSEQEYCLMWTNQGDADVLLSLEYERPQATSR